MVGGQRVPAAHQRDQHGARAAPDGIEHQDLHPRRRARSRCAARRPDRGDDRRACCPIPTMRRSRSPSTTRHRKPLAPLSNRRGRRSTARSPVCRRSSGCTESSTPHIAWPARRTCNQGQPDRALDRAVWLRTRPVPTRWPPIDMAAGMQTIANQGLHHDPVLRRLHRPRRRHPAVHAR